MRATWLGAVSVPNGESGLGAVMRLTQEVRETRHVTDVNCSEMFGIEGEEQAVRGQERSQSSEEIE